MPPPLGSREVGAGEGGTCHPRRSAHWSAGILGTVQALKRPSKGLDTGIWASRQVCCLEVPYTNNVNVNSVLTYHKARGLLRIYLRHNLSCLIFPSPPRHHHFLSSFSPHDILKSALLLVRNMALTLSQRYQGLIEPSYLLLIAMYCEQQSFLRYL